MNPHEKYGRLVVKCLDLAAKFEVLGARAYLSENEDNFSEDEVFNVTAVQIGETWTEKGLEALQELKPLPSPEEADRILRDAATGMLLETAVEKETRVFLLTREDPELGSMVPTGEVFVSMEAALEVRDVRNGHPEGYKHSVVVGGLYEEEKS